MGERGPRPALPAGDSLLARLDVLDLLDQLGLGAVVQEPDGAIVACNPSAARLLGVSIDRLLGLDSFDARWRAVGPDGDAMPGDRHPAMVAMRTDRVLADQLIGVEVPDEGLHWLSVTARPLHAPAARAGAPGDVAGQSGASPGVAGVITVFRDVSGSREATPALRTWERRYRRASEMAPVGMAILGGDGRTIRANEAFTALVDRTELALQERPWWRVVDLADPADARAAITAGMATPGGAFSTDVRLHAAGDTRTVRVHVRAIDDPDGRGEYVVIAEDVTAELAARHLLEQRAQRDPLTGLLHVRAFLDRLAETPADDRTAVVYVDIDRFKAINDTWGHGTGDAVLREIAARLRGQVRASDLVARAGGDEFIIALLGQGGPRADGEVVERLVAACRAPVPTAGGRVACSVSAGLAVVEAGAGPEELMRRADRALYAAKAAGRDRWARWASGGESPSPGTSGEVS